MSLMMKHLTNVAMGGVLGLSLVLLVLGVDGCRCSRDGTKGAASASSASTAASDSAPQGESKGTTVNVLNGTDKGTVVYVAFGADSAVQSASWSSFCTASAPLNCTFPLGAKGGRQLPLGGKYLNATFSFGAAVTCGITKAEINVNNPTWYDVMDVSLVDGFSNDILIDITPPAGFLADPHAEKGGGVKIFPRGKEHNEKAFGVYPFGCDICTARQNPPCNIPKGTEGCKAGSQYKPDVPCQYQGPVKAGGGRVEIMLVQPIPATPATP